MMSPTHRKPLPGLQSCHALAGAAAPLAKGSTQSVSQEQLFQLLNTAVYSSPEDPQRLSAVEQLGMLAPQIQALPDLGSAAAAFSIRLSSILFLSGDNFWQS